MLRLSPMLCNDLFGTGVKKNYGVEKGAYYLFFESL